MTVSFQVDFDVPPPTPVSMKPLLILFLTAACVVGDTQKPSELLPVGRYSLFQGESLFVLPNGHTSSIKMVWKVDSITGRAWHFYIGATTNATQEHWVETFDEPTTYSTK